MNRDLRRIVDANLNRVTEGLRVVEDVFRFAFDDAVMQQRLKSMRHRLASQIDSSILIASRDVAGDVGFASEGSLEERRATTRDIVRSNMKRVQEGLRVLEEILKLESPARAGAMKEMRYECYRLERSMERACRRTLSRGLYLILTDPPAGYEAFAEMAAAEGIPAIQLRYKDDDAGMFLRAARALREITRGTDTLFIVNDRLAFSGAQPPATILPFFWFFSSAFWMPSQSKPSCSENLASSAATTARFRLAEMRS